MPSDVEVSQTETRHEQRPAPEPEKTVTTTKETEGAVSGEPGAPVIKTVEREQHKEK